MQTKLCEKCKKQIPLNNFSRHICYTMDDINSVQELYEQGLSMRQITQKGFTKKCIQFALKDKSRNYSEACVLARKKYPNSYVCSDATKEKLSKARLLFLKNNPEFKPWSRESYNEKLFRKIIENNNLGQIYDIIKEYPMFPYYIDFAFTNVKLAVEIDGSLHWKNKNRIESDKKKDELLISNGWKVYRIPSFLIQQKFKQVEVDFLKYLSTIETQPKQTSFTSDIILYEEVKKILLQQKRKIKEQNKLNKDYERQLIINKRLEDIKYVRTKSELSRLWGISHTQVRRFLQQYAPLAQLDRATDF